MRPYPVITIFVLVLILFPAAGTAQQQEPLIGIDSQIAAARKMMRTERRLIHAAELKMTRDEANAFWPLYNDFSAELQVIGDRKVRLITDYADNFDKITEEFANDALKEAFEIDSDILKVQKKYLKEFKRALPVTKVVRFYQIESKLDAVIDFQLASQIPLMEIGPQ